METPWRNSIEALAKDLEHDPATIFALDRALRIVYCNEAWDRFARENGGLGLERKQQIGLPILSVVPEPLKQVYEEGYGAVLASGRPFELTYECSSPQVYRSFRMAVYANPAADGLVVVNSLLVEAPHGEDRVAQAAIGEIYTAATGLVTMCCHCRRTRRAEPNDVWDWVPAYVERQPAAVSHGICDVCLHLFYLPPPDQRGG